MDTVKTQTAEEHLSAVVREFMETSQLAEKWAKKWKVKARLIQGSTWAFHSDDGKVKVVGVLVASKEGGPAVLATKLYDAAEWSLRCGVNLAVVIGNRMAVVKNDQIFDAMGDWSPYVGAAGLVVPLGPLFHGTKADDSE